MPLNWCGCTATRAWPIAQSLEQQDMVQPWVVLEEEKEEEEEEGSSIQRYFSDED